MTIFKPDNNPDTTDQGDKDYLSELVGEGKKFADAAALAKGKAQSDAFILQLQNEMRELREDLAKRTTVEQFVDQLASRQPTSTQVIQTPAEDDDNDNPLTEADIRRLAREAYVEDQTRRTQEQNFAKAQALLAAEFGSNYVPVLQARARELGLSEDFLNSVAAQSPEALVKLVSKGESQVTNSHAPPRTNLNNQHTREDNVVKNQAYYNKLRQTDPKRYHSYEITVERHRQAQKMGESFFS
jgi:rRNA maturation endonuclease Nob1